MKPRTECEHETLQFSSGDYYIFCVDCGGKWCAHNASSREYDSLTGVGADPNVCVAPGNGLSGQRRYKSASHDSTTEQSK